VAQQIQGQEKDLGGGFVVRRLLPAARQRSVGPFIFFDHFGPAREMPGVNHDVRPHPHIGLATVTYLFEGAMMHRDSLGTEQLIEPGAVNWMTAGRGIVHSERKPDHLRDVAFVNHGLQLWVALPAEAEEIEPAFSHTPEAAIPQIRVGDAEVRLLVGEAFGDRSPVPAASPTLYLDVRLPAGAELQVPAAEERAVYLVAGEVVVDGEHVPAKVMQVLDAAGGSVRATAASRLVVIGGDALREPRFMWWNFVSTRRERIVQAGDDWAAMRMGRVPNDDVEFIPLPPTAFTPPEPRS